MPRPNRFELARALPIAVGVGAMCTSAHMSAVAAAFPLIAGHFDARISEAQWLLTIYTLVLTGCLLGFGRLGDRIGFRTVFLTGLTVFAIGSAFCAIAPSLPTLVALRAVQGIGAAMISASGVALLAIQVPRPRLGAALGPQLGMTYAGLALGPAWGGFAAQRFGWRAIFLANIPLAAIAFAATLLISKNVSSARPAPVIQTFLPLQLFRNRTFSIAVASEVACYLCLHAAGFLLPLYFIRTRNFSASEAGLLLGFQSATRALAALCGGRLSDWFGARGTAALGAAVFTAGLFGLCALGPATSTIQITASLACVGTGMGIFVPANSKALLSATPADSYGLSSGFLGTARNLGMTLGASLGALLFTQLAVASNLAPAFKVIAALPVLLAIAIANPITLIAKKDTHDRIADNAIPHTLLP